MQFSEVHNDLNEEKDDSAEGLLGLSLIHI